MSKIREDVNAVLGDVLRLKVMPCAERGHKTAQETFFLSG